MDAREIVGFVKMIKNYPALYNHTLPEYCDKELVDGLWKSVAKAHKVTVMQAKEKWRNIRNGYARSLRRFSESNKTRKQYYLHKHVEFLTPFLKSLTPATIITSDVEGEDNNDDSYDQNQIYFEEMTNEIDEEGQDSSEAENTKDNIFTQFAEAELEHKSKRSYSVHWDEQDTQIGVDTYEASASKKTKMVTNHREMFLLSLVPELDKLSDEQMLTFKVKVLTMLSMMLSKDTLDLNTTV